MIFILSHFLLVTDSNLGRISHRFQDMTSLPLKKKHNFFLKFTKFLIYKVM